VQRNWLPGVLVGRTPQDEGYRTWLRVHPAGLVVNSSSVRPRDAAMIHTARCPHIAYGPWLDGADLASAAYSYTTSPNAKICADSERVLIDYCRLSLHDGGSMPKRRRQAGGHQHGSQRLWLS
jgi:hypothetical protein